MSTVPTAAERIADIELALTYHGWGCSFSRAQGRLILHIFSGPDDLRPTTYVQTRMEILEGESEPRTVWEPWFFNFRDLMKRELSGGFW